MEPRGQEESRTARQIPKLKSLLKKYRHIKTMQSSLLKLSELASTVTDMDAFYAALESVIKTLLVTDSFHITLINSNTNQKNKLKLVYCYNPKENALLDHLENNQWQNSLTAIVFDTNQPFHCDAKMRSAMEKVGELKLISSQCVDWIGVPLTRNAQVIGVLALQSYDESRYFNKQDSDLLTFIAGHIVTAIDRVRSREMLELAILQRTKKLQQVNKKLEEEIAQRQILEKQQQAKLERLVTERTKELQAANLNLCMQIEERRKAEERLYFEAHHDALTKLPNRAMFSDRLSYAIKNLKRHINQRFTVLFIDLDRFKIINDTLGHHAGDLFLIEIAARLSSCVRDNDVLARLGGDEFVILLDALHSQDDVEEVASRIINAIEKPFSIEDKTLYSSASVGIALCSAQYKDSNEILRDADAAMYQAKSLGRGRYVFFDETMREQLIATMTLEQELRIAIKEQQFELHYQEISDLNSTVTIGFEALLRWNHPEKGLLTPSEFLFLAEETGIIIAIENWVVEEVSRQLSYWNNSPEYRHAFIAINLSGRHLTQANQLTKLISLIKQQPIEPQRLILEFNESAFNQHPEQGLKGLRKLKEFGVRLALDDYTSGLSSFNYIYNYPFEFIKLDRSFIGTLNSNENNLSLVKALHDLGDKFGYRLVAEGIESEDVLKKLHSVGCDFGQGYHISKPAKIENDNFDSTVQHYAQGYTH
ncbi:MAG: EAL domain-containing protein [Colwellia sp.]